MSFSSGDGLLLAGLLAAGLLLLSIAQFVRIPYPILLVLGGLALAFIPGVPHIQLRPEIVLVAVLPPLLYGSAYFTSLRELRANWRPIGALAIGLVLMTMVTVAMVAHEVIGLDWPTSFVLGAIVSPTDPTAATAIAHRLGLPRRDRKSTRLNSSHMSISYAVFCLKKKTSGMAECDGIQTQTNNSEP